MSDKLEIDDELRISQALFDLAHLIEEKYGLAGVRHMKAWCREKLPYGAFEEGHFDERL